MMAATESDMSTEIEVAATASGTENPNAEPGADAETSMERSMSVEEATLRFLEDGRTRELKDDEAAPTVSSCTEGSNNRLPDLQCRIRGENEGSDGDGSAIAHF